MNETNPMVDELSEHDAAVALVGDAEIAIFLAYRHVPGSGVIRVVAAAAASRASCFLERGDIGFYPHPRRT